jgi:hypothetical protein
MHQRPGESGKSPGRGNDHRRSGLGSRRVVAIAFALSFAIHVLAVLMFPVATRFFRPDGMSFRPPTTAGEPRGLQMLDLVEVSTTVDPEEPEDPEEIEQVETPNVTPLPVRIEGDPGAGEFAPLPISGAERIRPRFSDARLWQPIQETITKLSDQQREELLLAGRIGEFYDSLAIVEEAERKLTDWTFTDDDGKRWGFADGKIYLGDTVLPGTHIFGVPVGKRDEVAERMWQWEEIQRQGARAEVIESWKERQDAIRERRNRERAVRPDTTRARR